MKSLMNNMKFFICFILFSTIAYAQDPAAYLKSFDTKVYNLKIKGVRDLVVDIENPKLTTEMNDQGAFGAIKEIIFRVYWTSTPERLSVEIIGLPEGFKEVKEALKLKALVAVESLFPKGVNEKFAGFKITQGPEKREFTATDSSNLVPISSYVLRFDEQDRLVEITGNKVFGTLNIRPVYSREGFADGKWVLTSQTSEETDGVRKVILASELSFGKAQGIAVPFELILTTEQKNQESQKSEKHKETYNFKNYKINDGSAVKFFLAESQANQIVE